MSKGIKDESQKNQLAQANSELKNALVAWNELSAQLADSDCLSANEQMLKDIKVLLGELQSKIQEFEF